MPGFLSGESLLGVDEAYRFYFRLLFRIGTVCGNILFGFAFFMVARRMTSPKLKDYLTIAAIGDTIVGIALSTSALQQTYGIAAHSLVLLSSYLFSMGLYLSAIALSQDSSLRKSIKKSAVNLIGDIGSAQMEQQIEKRVTKLISDQQKELEEQTGGFSDEVTEKEAKDYVELVLNEKKRLTTADKG
jgi:signal transduction histidine kinase